MNKRNSNKAKKIKATWSDADRQAFADGNRVRAMTIPNKKRVASREACRRSKTEF